MWYQIKSYLFFLLKSTNQHGVHSPFVYDFITKCVYDTSEKASYSILKNIRSSLFNNPNSIFITDFGEGSKVFNTNLRKISAIAKNAGIPLKRQKLLFRIASYFKSENILELGTSLGLATTALAISKKAAIDTVEGCKNTSEIANSIFSKFNLKNITLYNSTFDDFFNSKSISGIYHLIYVDGNHNKEKTIKYFKYLLNHVNNDSVLIFDDIYWSKEMTEAWEEIAQNEQVKVSIDLYHWGLIFFRKEQQKQHFVIRM